MSLYKISTQADIENIVSWEAGHTFEMQNDIALTNWTVVGRTFTSGTFDGKGYKITGLTTPNGNAIKEGSATGYGSAIAIASGYNIGTVHTIGFTVQMVTGTTYGAYVVCEGNEIYGSVRIQNNNAVIYRCGDGVNSTTQSWTISTPVNKTRIIISRNGTSITLWQDGVSKGTKTLAANYNFTRFDSLCRHASGTWGAYFNEIILTTDAKASAWILADYNGGHCRYTTTGNTPNLANVWHCNEGSGTTIADSVGGKNGSGVDGWATFAVKGGFINLMNSASAFVKNLTIDTPVITDTVASNSYVGGIVNSCLSGTIDGCYVKDITVTSATAHSVGGIIGYATNANSIISNCRADILSLPTVNESNKGSGGLLGLGTGFTITNSFSTGGATNPPDCGVIGFIGSGATKTATNCFSTCTVGLYEVANNPIPFTATNVWYYDQGKGGTRDAMAGITADSTLADFYDVTHAPMSSWDFTPTGYWSKSQDTVTFPPFQTNFSGDISGTVSGYTSGKTMKLEWLADGYSVKYTNGTGTVGAFNSGYNYTLAFTISGVTLGANRNIFYGNDSNRVLIYSDGKMTVVMGGQQMADTGIRNWTGTHRVVITYSYNHYLRVYLDNVLVFNYTGGTAYKQLNNIINIGSAGYYTLDEVIFLNVGVDATWVATDYNNGNYKYYTSSEPNIVHGWHFDEGTGSTVADFKSLSTITLSGTTWETGLGSKIPNVYSATTTGSGDFSFTGVAGNVGTPLEIYISGDAVKGGLVSTFTDGLMGNVTGVSMAQDTLQIGDTKLNPNMTYALVNSASLYPLADTCIRTASNILYYRDGCDFLLPTGCSYTGTDIENDTAETGSITIDGDNSTITKLRSATAITLNGDVGTINVNNITADITVAGTAILNASTGVADLTNSGTLTFTGEVNGAFDNSGTFGGALGYRGSSMTNSATYSADTYLYTDTALIGSFDFTPLNLMTPAQTITFENGETYSFTGLTSAGTLGNEIVLQSDSVGDRFTLDNLTGGAVVVNYVDVKDSEVDTNDMVAYHSTQSNTDYREGTPQWVFPIDISAFITELK